jgi:hypothetical protein
VRERVAALRPGGVLRRWVRSAHSVRARVGVGAALLVGVASWLGVGPASAVEVCAPPSVGAFCGELSAPDSVSGSSSFSGLFSVESECSPQGSLVPVSDLPSGSLPSWLSSEGGPVCVQIVYSIPQGPDPGEADQALGTAQWREQLTARLVTFQLIGLLVTFLLAALFMRTKARV